MHSVPLITAIFPRLKALEQHNMLCGHSPDCTKMLRVQELHKEHRRHHVRASSSKMLKPAPEAPMVDSSFAVAREICNLPHGQHIGISVQAAYVVFGHILASQRQRHLGRASVPFSIPTDGRHIPLWKDGSLLQIFLHICLLDLIAACLLTAVLAGHPAAAQKLQGSCFADMANPVELLLAQDIGKLVPVINFIFHYEHLGSFVSSAKDLSGVLFYV